MNSSEGDFQKKLDEIGKLYEDGKDALNNLAYSHESELGKWEPGKFKVVGKVYESIRGLRDIAAMAVKAAYQIKEN